MAEKIEIEVYPTYTSEAMRATQNFFKNAVDKTMADLEFSGISKIGREVKAVGGIAAGGAGAAMGAITGPIGALGAAADMISKFTNALNPAIMEQFSMAMKDIFAVVGQALVPAFEILTPAIQMMGDFIASILPDTHGLVDAMKPILEAFRQMYAALAPLYKAGLEVAITVVTKAFEVLAGMVQTLMTAMAVFADFMLKAVPNWVSDDIAKLHANVKGFLAGEKIGFGKTSRGAAGQGAAIVGVSDLTRSAIAAGFGGGGGPQESTAKNTEKTAEATQGIWAALVRLGGDLDQPAEEARGEIPV